MSPIPKDRTRKVRRAHWRAVKRERREKRLAFLKAGGDATPGAFGLLIRR